MSSPNTRQVLEGVQHLANYLSYAYSRGEASPLQTATGRLLAQGLEREQIESAIEYAERAHALTEALKRADPDTQLSALPEYAALGTQPQVQMTRVYSETGDLQSALGAPGTEYRESMYAGGPYFSRAFAEETASQEEADQFGPSADSDYVGMVLDFVKPFDLYA